LRTFGPGEYQWYVCAGAIAGIREAGGAMINGAGAKRTTEAIAALRISTLSDGLTAPCNHLYDR
jgi:hypothetical protein